MLRTLFIAVATYCTIFACNGLTTPPTGPGTEYPCGVWGIPCSTYTNVLTSKQSAMCCPQNHVCGFDGAFSRCPAGFCCYEGDEWLDEGKVLSPLPQYKMTTWNLGSGR